MRDIYLYDDCMVLKNKLEIKEQKKLEEAEADFVVYRLKELTMNPLKGNYDYEHFLQMHKYIFQDLYEWAGIQRKMNIYKEEPVLGGLSIDYADVFDIASDMENILKDMREKSWSTMKRNEAATQFSDSLAQIWKVHCFREGNTRTTITFCCQYADEMGLNINRELFEKNSQYVRTALVAYNAVFNDLGDLSKKNYLEQIVFDAIQGKEI